MENYDRFVRDIYLKVFFWDSPMDTNPPPLYVKSKWRPHELEIPDEVHHRIADFYNEIRPRFNTQKKGRSNLTPYQTKLLTWLREQKQYIIAKTDKGLGPCAVEYSRYAQDVMAHLSDPAIYQFVSKQEADEYAQDTMVMILTWLCDYAKSLDLDSRKFIRHYTTKNMEDPHGYFYIMYKIHKLKVPIPIRPVCSDCASVTFALGKWIDVMLQPMAKSMPTYFKDTFELKERLDAFQVKPGMRLFTAGAKAMYTCINPTAALPVNKPIYVRRQHNYNSTTLQKL